MCMWRYREPMARNLWSSLRHALTPHSHDSAHIHQTAEESSGVGIRAAWIGLAGMMATAIMQVVIVAVSGSVGLLADTVHNLGHAATTIPLIIAFRLGQRPSSKRFPYGLRRAEDLVGLFIGLIVAFSAAWIIWDSINALVRPRPVTNLGWVFAAGVIGFLGNEIVAVYRIRAGRRIGSAALVAEGQHARADGLSSIAVVAGIVGVWAGFPRADAIVGLLIGLLIIVILIKTMGTILRRLLDGVEEGVIDRMTVTAGAVNGVASVERARARWVGHRMEGDVIVRIDPELKVTEAHRIADRIEHELLHEIPFFDVVVVHLHPTVDPAAIAAAARRTN